MNELHCTTQAVCVWCSSAELRECPTVAPILEVLFSKTHSFFRATESQIAMFGFEFDLGQITPNAEVLEWMTRRAGQGAMRWRISNVSCRVLRNQLLFF